MGSRNLGLALLGLLLLGLGLSCLPSVDPNRGRYSCTDNASCGRGYDCKSQAAGGSLCFRKGTCVDESCNGRDDDCDGLVDEAFPNFDQPCGTGLPGVCDPGRVSCVDGVERCQPEVAASAERCNQLDDDCNGQTDDSACLPGAACQAGSCREIDCADGIDNDGDGGVDCADPSCQQRPCFTTEDAGYVCGKFPEATDAGPDAGPPDAGPPDAGPPDAGSPDAGSPDAGPPDAGSPDAGPPDAGIDAGTDGGRFFCFPAEQCADGLDDDQDGLTDCADPDCDNRTCVSGTVCTGGLCPGPG